MSQHESILIVEDDESILAGLEMNLRVEGYRVRCARDGQEGLLAFEAERPDLIILDLMLPEMNGLEVLAALRRRSEDVPVVLLTARDSQQDKVSGLSLGADDYVTKPFALPELLARINAALRRARLRYGSRSDQISFGQVVIETASRRVSRAGEEITMTSKEYDLLVCLARARDRVLSREQILRAVWGDAYDGTERTVDNFVARLRTKLENDPDNPRHIQTVRGVGYRFEP